eukprot:3941930-Rhodomonas_salina.10
MRETVPTLCLDQAVRQVGCYAVCGSICLSTANRVASYLAYAAAHSPAMPCPVSLGAAWS